METATKERPKILSAVCTCFAFPAQWECKTVDGQVVYIRYRCGRLTVGVGKTLRDAVLDRMSWHAKIGDKYDGEMTPIQMLVATSPRLDWSTLTKATEYGPPGDITE